ncbi:barstar family protein [Janibacter sp. G349]|uniref:barstar family protein n=1 Tax=unclassified Janibacter TaxID=2649294 RepID=UPI0020CF4567|nr:barstar family protein [Janibacter sp. CX7]UTT67111.1 barstar family protein [Janibacter sp. CX7]
MIHIEAAGVDGLLARAVTSTDHVHLVDGGSGREETYDRFAEALVLPEHFGRNLDALMDCLRDVADRHEGPWTLVWRPGHGGADPGVLDVLGDLDDEYPDLSIVVADR